LNNSVSIYDVLGLAIKAYDVPVDAIAWVSVPDLPSYGSTVTDWPESIAIADNRDVRVSGSISIHYKYRLGLNIDNVNNIGTGITTRKHEERHAEINIIHWNALVHSFVNSYEGKYNTAYCASIVARMINARLGLAIYRAYVDHNAFHIQLGLPEVDPTAYSKRASFQKLIDYYHGQYNKYRCCKQSK
jgi:hypothetical protein